MASENDKQKAEELKRDDQDVRQALEETAAINHPINRKVEAQT